MSLLAKLAILIFPPMVLTHVLSPLFLSTRGNSDTDHLFNKQSCSHGTAVNIVAHEDDDLLFMNPDILHDIEKKMCIMTLFVTAGDAGSEEAYWLERENGSQAAYASMARTSNYWDREIMPTGRNHIIVSRLREYPQVILVFLRFPDGNIDGGGFDGNNRESLAKIWSAEIPFIHTVDSQTQYSKEDLIQSIFFLLKSAQPNLIRILDRNETSTSDHSDHTAAAQFAYAAEQRYLIPHQLFTYQGYSISQLPVNLTNDDIAMKQQIFFTYIVHDNHQCQTIQECTDSDMLLWIKRQYVSKEDSVTGDNGKPPSLE